MSSTRSTPSIYAEVSANGAPALIAVAGSLLDRQRDTPAKAFQVDEPPWIAYVVPAQH